MFKKSLIILSVALVALSSCNTPVSKTGGDHYKFETKEYTANQLGITVVEYKSRTDLQKAYFAITKKSATNGDRSVEAFTQLRHTPGTNTSLCTIHLIDPAVLYEPEFVGHELIHCIHGEFHPNQP